MSDLLADMDHLLNANDRFLVGRWIAEATSWATDEKEKRLLEMNARNQITLWGPNGEVSLNNEKFTMFLYFSTSRYIQLFNCDSLILKHY